MGTFLYGTSSWSEPSWVGPFYPPGAEPADFLRLYAEHFRTVEADVTYYRVPDARLVDGWRSRTPEGFVLSAKFPRSIVHAGQGAQPDGGRLLVPAHCEADCQAFLAAMERLGNRCGPLVLQFPYFNKSAFATRAPFLERLDAFLGRLPPRFRYAVELRNRTWLDASLCELLRRHRAALVLVDMSYMPHPAELATRLDPVTTDFVYARLIGDRKAVEARTKTFDRVVLDQGARLAAWAGLLAGLRDRVDRGFIYANNHYA
ncbi:MAG TPA: DUF72 domain-containing protein, partial [Planctomycetota bacterium]|nr:DUF72 domain-containing protein [Planctomycetota bacterium]